MGKLLKWFLDWPIVAISGASVVVISWPWAHHVVAYMFAFIFFAVLVWEVIAKFFFPEKKTVSDDVRDETNKTPVRFWLFIGAWILFALILALHFSSRIFGSGQ